MKIKHVCPNCKKNIELDIDVSGREKNKFGYLVNSKGDRICEYIEKNPACAYNDILLCLLKLYPHDNSTGRLNRVLNELKSRGYIVEKDRVYKLLKK